MTVDKKTFSNELIDALLGEYKKPEDLIGENGLLKHLTKALVERTVQAEMTELFTPFSGYMSVSKLDIYNQACSNLPL